MIATSADPVLDRFMAKISMGAPDGCWMWTASTQGRGYGQFKWGTKVVLAHKTMYEIENGPVPAGMLLDHTCHNDSGCPGGVTCPHRRCCNPAHMEPVTSRTNNLRGEGRAAEAARRTHCIRGHEFNDANTYVQTGKSGAPKRACRACNRNRKKDY